MIEFLTGLAFAAVITLPWIIDQQYTINRLHDQNTALKNQVRHLGMVIINKDAEIARLKNEQKGEDHEPQK